MRTKSTLLGACALLVAGSACAHDSQREHTTVSAVTNQEVAGKQEEIDKTRMHYTEVSDEHALGHDQQVHSTLQEGNGLPRAEGGAVAVPTQPQCASSVYFDTDSARLDQGSQKALDIVAECIKHHETDHATIVGSADPTGKKQHNDQLSLERARVVAEYLRGRGVPESDIRVRGKGEVASADRDLWPVERNAQVNVTH